MWSEVIAISATTPKDSLKKRSSEASQTWEYWWGSTWGSQVDFAAPGVIIPTTDFSSPNGYNPNGNYKEDFGGTSAAAPIASSIAAMILQFDSALPVFGNNSVYEFLKRGAEQVGGYNYNHDPNDPGKSLELGYGRLNACNSLNLLLSQKEQGTLFQTAFRVARLQDGEIRAYYNLSQTSRTAKLKIRDLQGQELLNLEIPKGSHWQRIPTERLSNGLYLITLDLPESNWSTTQKLIVLH